MNNFLITYHDEYGSGFMWFETEDELIEWANNKKQNVKFHINEMYEILNAREIELP